MAPGAKEIPMAEDKANLLDLTAEIVAAYASNNTLPGDQLTTLIQQVYHGVATLSGVIQPEEPKAQPAVPIRKSVRPDEIVCLECGKGQKVLKRHISSAHGLTPEEYRAKWGLAPDYPMVAPNYAERRSQLAKEIGLGQKKPERAGAKGRPAARGNGGGRRGGRKAQPGAPE